MVTWSVVHPVTDVSELDLVIRRLKRRAVHLPGVDDVDLPSFDFHPVSPSRYWVGSMNSTESS